MKRFIATSPKFAGELRIVYSESGRLLQLDFMAAELSEEQTEYFKRMVPVVYDQAFMRGFAKTELTFIQEGYEITFEMFWDKYGKKVNPDRCKALWKWMSTPDHIKAFFGIDRYNRMLQKHTWRSKADPQTYLKDKFWNNEWDN
jgi:hypothetical protein